MTKGAVRTVAVILEERQPELAIYIAESPEHYTGRTSLAAKLNISLREAVDEPNRLGFAGWLFDRVITSTKDLTLAEGIAICRCAAILERIYEDEYLAQRQPV